MYEILKFSKLCERSCWGTYEMDEMDLEIRDGIPN